MKSVANEESGDEEFFFADPKKLVPRPARVPTSRERKLACGSFTLVLFSFILLLTNLQDNNDAMPTSLVEPVQLKYLIYTPTSNDDTMLSIAQLESAMILSKMLNRTLYVPQIANGDSADQLLDFPRMMEYCQVIALDITVPAFLNKHQQQYVVLGPYKHSSEALQELQNNTARMIEVNRIRMPAMEHEQVQQYLRYSSRLRELSLHVVNETFQGSKFYAIHGKLGNEREKWMGKSSSVFLSRRQVQKWNHAKLFIASEQPKDPFFDSVRRHFKHVVDIDDAINNTVEYFSPVLQALICAQAEDFSGSSFSTQTWDILRIRKHRSMLFPELQ